MQNLIATNAGLNLDEAKNGATSKPVASEFSDKFNKIFKNAKSRQDELNAPRSEAKRQAQPKEFLTTKKDEPVKEAQEPTEVKIESEDVDKIVEDLKKVIELLTPKAGEEALVDDELKQSLTDALNKLIQVQNSGAEITDEMVQEIDELLNKVQTAGILTTGDSGEIKDKLNSIIVDIKNILKNSKETTDTSQLPLLESDKPKGILVDEKNIEAPQSKNSIKVEKNPEISIKDTVEQKILDELNLNVDKVIVATKPQESAVKTTTDASEQLIKLSIEKVSPGFETSTSSNNPQMNGQNLMGQNAQTNSTQVQEATAPAKFADINKTDVLNQIGSKFEQMRDGGNSRITLTLRPNDLGRVVIELNHNGNGVSTSIIAQNQSVKEILEKNIEVLKQQLAAAGVNVQNINVKSAEFNPQGSFEDEGSQGGGQQEGQQGESQGFTSSNNENQEQQEGQFEKEHLVEHDGEVNYKV